MPGIDTSLASGLLRAVVAVAAVWCVGSLVYAVFARQRSGEHRFDVDYFSDGRPVVWSAAVWAVAAFLGRNWKPKMLMPSS